jgi:hypothetical protein
MLPEDVFAEDDNRLLTPSNAMAIVALERQTLHDKIIRLRALRELRALRQAAEATKAPTKTKGRPARRWIPAH